MFLNAVEQRISLTTSSLLFLRFFLFFTALEVLNVFEKTNEEKRFRRVRDLTKIFGAQASTYPNFWLEGDKHRNNHVYRVKSLCDYSDFTLIIIIVNNLKK